MAGRYGVYFGDTDEGAATSDGDDLVINEDDGWRCHEAGSLEDVAYWIVREFNDDDLPGSDDTLMRIVKYPDDSIADGEKVVL